MMVRGIVSQQELEQIRSALPHHGLVEDRAGEFRTWMEDSQGECLIWVEVDVQEELGEYLARSGFFDENQESKPVKQIRCPQCGNTNPDQIRLRVKTVCFLQLGLKRDDNGSLIAEEDRPHLADLPRIDGTDLICTRCKKAFRNPGIAVK